MSEVKVNINKKKKSKRGRKKKVVLPKKDLTMTGFSVILNEKKKCYELVTLKYDLDTKQAFVESSKFLADSEYRAEFELRKMLAHGELIQISKENK